MILILRNSLLHGFKLKITTLIALMYVNLSAVNDLANLMLQVIQKIHLFTRLFFFTILFIGVDVKFIPGKLSGVIFPNTGNYAVLVLFVAWLDIICKC